MSFIALMKGVLVSSLSAATTGTGTPVNVPITSDHLYIVVLGAGTISAGTLILEEAHDPEYAGLWSQLQSIDLTTLTGADALIIHINATFRAVRARLSADVTGGGNVTVQFMSN